MLEMALKRRDEQIRQDVLREMNNNMNNKIIETKKETKIETAKKMIEDNFSIESITRYTGLTEEEIRKLLQ